MNNCKLKIILIILLFFIYNGCEIGIISPTVRMEKITDIKKHELSRYTSDGMLYHYLHSKDSQVRAAAILALGRIGNPEAISYLIKALSDSDIENVKAAIFALGLIGNKSVENELIGLLEEKPDLNAEIIEALGMLKSRNAVDKILYKMKGKNALIVKSGAYALASIEDKKALSEIRKYVSYTDDDAREAIYYALYKMADSSSLDAFIKGLEDKNAWVRYYSAKGIGSIKEEEALPYLYNRIRDPEWNVVVAILEALSNFKQIDIKKIESLKDSKNHHIRCELAKILSNYKGKEVLTVLKKLLKDKSDMVRKDAIISLSKVDEAEALKFAAKNYNKEGWIIKTGIAEALGNINSSKSIEMLKEMISDRDLRVKEAALEALGNFENSSIERIFSECIMDDDAAIRAICAKNLSKYKNKNFDEKYVKALIKSVYEKEYESQQLIIKSLLEVNKDLALDILKEMIKSENLGIRIMTAELLKEEFSLDYFRLAYDYQPEFDLVEYEGYSASPLLYIETNKGNFVIRLYGEYAPLHTANMMNLAKSGFYNNLIFHRVEPGYVVQGGDIRGDGWGTAGINIPDEINNTKYERGTVGMPLAGKDTGGCQFFITLSPQPKLNYRYTGFGEVINGMDTVDNLEIGDRILKIIVIE